MLDSDQSIIIFIIIYYYPGKLSGHLTKIVLPIWKTEKKQSLSFFSWEKEAPHNSRMF